jgi:hypothetical protein
MFNIRAGSKWIYTVPGFEELKLFEMPLLGFLGFPPFALECFVIYRTLVLSGVAKAWEPEPHRRPGAPLVRAPLVRAPLVRAAAWGVAALILVATPPLMDRYTLDSRVVRVVDLLALRGPEISAADAAALASRTPADLVEKLGKPGTAAELGIDAGALADWRARARLALLKGIGIDNLKRLEAVGIGSVEELAGIDGDQLAARMAAANPAERVVASRVRVWVRAARRATGRAAGEV